MAAILAPYVFDGINPFLTLNDVMRLRSGSRVLCAAYTPSNGSSLWIRLRPKVHMLALYARYISLLAAKMILKMYSSAMQISILERLLINAIRSGNTDVVKWAWEEVRPNIDEFFNIAFDAGFILTMDWIVHQPHFVWSYRRAYLSDAAALGDIELANWLLSVEYGSSMENGPALLERALLYEHLDFADWVISKFPVNMSDELIDILVHRILICSDVPLALRWIIERLELSEDKVRVLMPDILNAIAKCDSDDDSAKNACKWFINKFGTP